MDVLTGKKQTLLSNISFVQWVPQSDVVIAQSNNILTIWYNIDVPEHIVVVPIRGEIIDVIREKVNSNYFNCCIKFLFRALIKLYIGSQYSSFTGWTQRV